MGLSIIWGVLTSGTRFSTLSEVKVGLGFGGKMPFTKTQTVSFSFPPFCPPPPPLTPMDSECWKPLCCVLLWGKPCYILSIHYHSNLNAAPKYLELVGAHFKNYKEIPRLMCQWPSPARGRMPWREYLNKTFREISRIEPCRHCCSWKFIRTRSRLWHSVIFFPWQSSWWLFE